MSVLKDIGRFLGGFEKESDMQDVAEEMVTFIRDLQSRASEVWKKSVKA